MEIRAYYAVVYAQAQADGVTQQAIAQRGGIAGQNSVSRLLSNDHLGPSVEIFVRAVEGLGLSLSEFFAEFERSFAAQAEAASSAASAASAASNGRTAHANFSLSDRRLTTVRHDPGPQDQPQIEPILRAATQGILARLDRIDAQVAALGRRDGNVPPRPSAPHRPHRRRATDPTGSTDTDGEVTT
jgi:transcriptional regulator with XRE-family HTH domain